MPLPGNVGTGTVTGQFTNDDGSAASGVVEFVPAVPWLLDASADEIIVLNKVRVTLDGTGSFSQVLIITDDVDLDPIDWTWLVRVNLDRKPKYHFPISVHTGTQDLADIGAIPASHGYVLVGDGDKGDITVSMGGTIWTLDAGVVDTTELATGAVTNVKLATDAVSAVKIADNAVTNAKMADASVGTSELINSSVTGPKINDNAITQAKIADQAVGTAELAGLSVTTGKIADFNVTTAKLANNAVTAAKVAADVATQAELNAVEDLIDSLVITGGGMAPSTAGQVRDGTNNTTAVTPLALADGLGFLRVFDGTRARAIVLDPDMTKIDLVSGRNSRPLNGYFDLGDLGERPPKWYARGMVAIWEEEDSPEMIGRRSTGRFVDGGKDTFASLTTQINFPFSSVTEIHVDDLDAYLPSGTVMVDNVGDSRFAVWEYTSVDVGTGILSGLTFLNGSTTGPLLVGANVQSMIVNNTNLLLMYGQADMGVKGGFQDRSAYITVFTTEAHRPDGFGHYYSSGHLKFGTSSLGPESQRREQMVLDEKGTLALEGSFLIDKSAMSSLRRLQVAPKSARTATSFALPQATIPALDPTGFPTTGSFTVASTSGDQVITYTGYSINMTTGHWEFTGCTGGTGTVALSAHIIQTKQTIVANPVVGVKGNIAAADWADDQTTVIGGIGPTTAAPEGGIRVGNSSGVVSLYRGASSEWWSKQTLRFKLSSGSVPGVAVGSDTDTEPRISMRIGRLMFGAGGVNPVDIALQRVSSTELMLRDSGDTADRDLRLRQLRFLSGGPTISSGTGTPEGAVTAPVGSLFLRTDNANALYVKQTGAGNTGWVLK